VVRMRLYFAILSLVLGASTSVLAQSASVDTGCPAPGQARGPRQGGLGVNGQRRGPERSQPGPAADALSGSQNRPGGEPAGLPRKRLLIWADTRNGLAQHDIGHAMAVIEELGYKSGLYDTWIRTDSNIISRHPKMTTGQPASGGPSLCNVDAIFFLGHREIELDAAGKADLLWFIHDAGKGFVAAHTGTTAFMESWPEFGQMLGGRFDQHPWGTLEAPVIVSDPNFPGLQKLGKEFTIREEFYQSKDFSPEKSRVLLRLDTSRLDMTRNGVQAADAPYPLAWARMYGKGRVFYSAFGHSPATWDDPKIQDIYLGAIKWALGLVDADVTPVAVPATVTP
jgi:type 1 glutamine amidotransferase